MTLSQDEKQEWLHQIAFEENKIKMQLRFIVAYEKDLKHQIEVNNEINQLLGALFVVQTFKNIILNFDTI
jgi:hypothetical protein